MSNLLIYNREVKSIFQLLGRKENNISYSVGYGLSYSQKFLSLFLKSIGVKTPFDPSLIKINLQTYESDGGGFTDFEIIQDGEFHIIIEAKRGWSFPTLDQLNKYVSRPSFAKSTAKDKLIIIFNESTPSFTLAHFPFREINGIPVEVVSWMAIKKLIDRAKILKPYKDNFILGELSSYIDQISTMQKKDSNLVYVVSLGTGIPIDSNWKISYQDIVNIHSKYFHPVGGGSARWPAEPPNYIAFRYNGKLQSIHHIAKYQVFTDPSLHIPEIPQDTWEPHYLYDLGPAMVPAHPVVTGNRIPRSMRVWASIDCLLTCNSVEEARDKTKLRMASL